MIKIFRLNIFPLPRFVLSGLLVSGIFWNEGLLTNKQPTKKLKNSEEVQEADLKKMKHFNSKRDDIDPKNAMENFFNKIIYKVEKNIS